MIHEILLGLAGHPSPLFVSDASASQESFPGLTNAEKALLKTLSPLALGNCFLRRHLRLISRSHSSVVCRAVAAAIQGPHLTRFQQHILNVERRILQADAGIVGAYNIVPLAAVVAEFEAWQRPMEWYCKVAVFMQAPENVSSTGRDNLEASGIFSTKASCSAAQLIDRLRAESQTGFAQIEKVALELGKVAEMAWLRQVSSWVLYGKFLSLGQADFFVIPSRDSGEASVFESRSSSAAGNSLLTSEFSINTSLVPKFVSRETAESIFALGRTLHSVRAVLDAPTANHIRIVPDHARILAQLAVPLSNSSLANAVEEIRQSFSINVLRPLLPLPRIQQLLTVFHEFFLLARGEFAICLVHEADKTLKQRNKSHRTTGLSLAPDFLLRDSEIPLVLSRTWTAMLAFIDNDGIGDTQMDFAREVLSLQADTGSRTPAQRTAGIRTLSGSFVRLPKQAKHFHVHELPSFHDLLLNPTPAALTLRVPSPLDLFVGDEDIRLYSDVHAYLLSIRRAHIRLSGLWRHSILRRTLPSSRSSFSKQLALRLRPVWATCMTAIFVLSGMMEYFSDSVVRTGWAELMAQIGAPTPSDARQAEDSSAFSHNPEAILSLHREFLQSLYLALLLDDQPFTTALHALLLDIDGLVGAIVRLEQIVSQIVAASDDYGFEGEGEEEGMRGLGGIFANDLIAIYAQLEGDRRRTHAGVRTVVRRLRSLNQDGRDGELKLQMGGIERLLMRLHLASGDGMVDNEDGHEIEADGRGESGADSVDLTDHVDTEDVPLAEMNDAEMDSSSDDGYNQSGHEGPDFGVGNDEYFRREDLADLMSEG